MQAALSSGNVFVRADGDKPDLLVPEQARADLKEFKDLVLRVIEDAIFGAIGDKDPSEHLAKSLRSHGVAIAQGESWQEGAFDVEITKVPAHSNLWAVVGAILLAPGSDQFLALYDVGADGKTREVHVVRNDDYATIEGAIHALEFKVSRPSDGGDFLLVEAHTHPWMASRWRDFSYRAYRVGDTVRKVVDQNEPESNWENGYRLTVTDSDFEIAFDVWREEEPSFQQTETRWWYGLGSEFFSAETEAPKSYAAFYEVLRRAIAAGDRRYVASQIRFPVRVSLGRSGVRREVKNEEEFIRDYDKLISPEWKRALATGDIEETPTWVYAGTNLQLVMGQICEDQEGFCPAGPIKILEFRRSK